MLDNWTTEDLSIGQVAKIHNISPKMLRYWDRIGVLKPANTDEITGYRYYSTEQFHVLNFIVYMRSMGLSYDEIKAGLKDINRQSLQDLLDSQIVLTEQKILDYKTVKSRLENLREELIAAKKIDQTGKVKIVHYPDRKIVSIKGQIRTRLEFENYLMKLELKTGNDSRLLVPRVGLLMDKDDFKSGNYDAYKGLFVFQEDFNSAYEYVQIVPGGFFANIYKWGRTEDSSGALRQIHDFIDENNLKITGDIMRRVVAAGMRQGENGHLAEFMVPVDDSAQRLL